MTVVNFKKNELIFYALLFVVAIWFACNIFVFIEDIKYTRFEMPKKEAKKEIREEIQEKKAKEEQIALKVIPKEIIKKDKPLKIELKPSTGKPRQVDVKKIKKLVNNNELSGKEGLFYKKK